MTHWHVVSISTGLSSALVADRVIDRYGDDPDAKIRLVFMDTLIEDDDNYRFLSDCRRRWRRSVARLVEGRNPYQVFSDKKIIPNTLRAPCTAALKIEPFVRFVQRLPGPKTIHIGYDFRETHRIPDTKAAYEAMGWAVDFPLLWKPYEFRDYSVVVREWGIEPPRMYAMGYSHANCGGTCVKQGMRDWIRTLIYFPERFAAAEAWEQAMRTGRRANYSILKDRRGGQVRPYTLRQLREDYEAGHVDPTLFDADPSCVVCGVGDVLRRAA
jgi:hypothetical protein